MRYTCRVRGTRGKRKLIKMSKHPVVFIRERKEEMKSQSAWCVCSVVLLGSFLSGLGHSLEEEAADPFITTRMSTLGGVRETRSNQNSAEVEELGRFAVQEHNKKQNALLEFGRIVKAKEQVVSGTLHHLTVEVIDAGKNNLYEAKVWVKPWLNFKELQEFTPSDLGASQGNTPLET